MITKKLGYLLDGFANTSKSKDLEIKGLAMDSRLVLPNDLFIAISGVRSDSRNFIKEALENGASAVICEKEKIKLFSLDELLKSEKVIPISNLKEKIGSIAAKFYDYPSKKMTVIGITGTNGKTSCSFFISDILNKNNIVCGIIGTLGWGLKMN